MSEPAPPELRGILKLPCELVASILRQLDSVEHLLPPRLACRHINDSFLQNPSLANDVLRKQIPHKAVPYAVAAFQVFRRTSSLEACKSILNDLHHEPGKLDRRLQDMAFTGILKIYKRHSIVHDLAESFSTAAWAQLGKDKPVSLSAAEKFRFQRAFYRFNILCAFNRAHERAGSASGTVDEVKKQLLSWCPLWAKEQIGCVPDFLEFQLLAGIRETVAYDVELGEYSVDYLETRAFNPWLQARLSRGIEHTHELIYSTSADQADLLQARSDDTTNATIFDVLWSELDEGADDDDEALEDYAAPELDALNPHPDLEDTDEGPYEAWYQTHKDMPHSAFVMFQDDEGLRERTYVLWDSRRLHEEDLLELFRNLGTSFREYTGEEYEAMKRSWDARSEIWLKGGRGWWDEGDESRIVWP